MPEQIVRIALTTIRAKQHKELVEKTFLQVENAFCQNLKVECGISNLYFSPWPEEDFEIHWQNMFHIFLHWLIWLKVNNLHA